MTFMEDQSQPAYGGYSHLAILFAMFIGRTIFYRLYLQHVLVLGMRINTQTVAAIYRKVLTMSSQARAKFSTGEIINLVTIDSERLKKLPHYFNFLCINMLQILTVLYIAWLEFGFAILPGFLSLVTLATIDSWFNQISIKIKEKLNRIIDERIQTISQMLTNIKIIKLYAWEKAFIDKINFIRGREMQKAEQINRIECLSGLFIVFGPVFVAFLTFATFSLLGGMLDPIRVLYGLSLFEILRNPITFLPFVASQLSTTKISIRRLNNFLGSRDQENYIKPNYDDETCIVIDKGSFSWAYPEENKEKQRECLQDISLRVKPQSFVAVVGEVGSGKTSLLNAILGNMQLESGQIKITSTDSVAYVPQVAWIQNNTLRNNILFGLPFDEARYQSIIGACCLGPDFQMLSGGDLTEIGEKGINLSGGQKQRTSLARAVYADADIYLLDDTLSAGKQIFTFRCFIILI